MYLIDRNMDVKYESFIMNRTKTSNSTKGNNSESSWYRVICLGHTNVLHLEEHTCEIWNPYHEKLWNYRQKV